MRSYPFDPINNFDYVGDNSEDRNAKEFCVYIRDKRTGEIETICDSDLPF